MPNPLYDTLFAPLTDRDSPFLLLADGAQITGAEFARMVAQFGNALRALGLMPGDRLAAQIEKSPQALALYGAAVAVGVVYLPLNPAYTADEIGYFTQDSGARVLLADPIRADALAPVAKQTGAQLLTLDAAGQGSFATLAADQPTQLIPASRSDDDLAALLYTSGTTGRSKGAMLTQKNLLSNAQVLAREWQFSADDVLLHMLPIFHTHGLFVASNTVLLTGGAMLFLPSFSPAEALRLMPLATTMMGVPTFYTRLLDDAQLTRDAVAHMRLFVSGSAPLLAETHTAFETRTGHRVLERYGMTETNMNSSNPYAGARRAGTVGLPLAGVEIIITDPNSGEKLPQGTPGMIEVRGPNVFQGYWQMPDKTAAELRDNGFFITGDIGVIDDQGYLSIVGRQKDLVITGGLNVYPKEVEELLDALPGVRETAVIGVPHPDFGEAVVAIVVPEPTQGPALDPDAMMAQIRDKIARFKQPKAILLREALPRNTMGKVQKAALRAELGALFTQT